LKETKRIAQQLRRACYGPAWHGTPLHEIVAPVDHREAAKRPRVGQHSIWELVLHTRTWIEIVHKRMERAATASARKNFPQPAQTTAAAWHADQESLWRAVNALAEAIEKRPDRWLETIVPGRPSQTQYVSLHGVVQHLLYHAGQIALLRKR
jgi:uncharacterized damage-inducible protein DinB